MNNHFDDSLCFLTRAAEHARLGVLETREAVADRVRTLFGHPDPEPEPTRVERVRAKLTTLERSAETRVRTGVESARK